MAERAPSAAMRLDLFLWWVRIVRSRSVAQAMATSGHLRLDGRAIDRAAAPVRVGSVLTFAGAGGRVRAIRVEALPARRGPAAEARGCYADLLTGRAGPAADANVSQQAPPD